MATVLVTYDLHDNDKEKDLLDYIRSHAYAKLCDSSYAIVTDSTLVGVVEKLRELTGNKITCFAVHLNTKAWAGFGQGEAVYNWLNSK